MKTSYRSYGRFFLKDDEEKPRAMDIYTAAAPSIYHRHPPHLDRVDEVGDHRRSNRLVTLETDASRQK